MRVVQTGGLQAQENPLTRLLGFSIWKYHPGHLFGVLLLTCRRQWFDALPPRRPAAQEGLNPIVFIAAPSGRAAAA